MLTSSSSSPLRFIPFTLVAAIFVLLPACSGGSGSNSGSDAAGAGGSSAPDAAKASDAGATGGIHGTGGTTAIVGTGGATGSGGATADAASGTGGAVAIDASVPDAAGGTGGSPAIDGPAALDGSTSGEAGASEAMPVDMGLSDAGATEAAGSAGPEVGVDAPVTSGDCMVAFGKSTANIADPSIPMTTGCAGAQFGTTFGNSQFNFTMDDVLSGTSRGFNVDWFDITSAAGTTLKVEDGYDFSASRGIHVSYMEFVGTNSKSWTADTGAVTIKAISGASYTVELKSLHYNPTPDPFGGNPATGSFEIDGTITVTVTLM